MPAPDPAPRKRPRPASNSAPAGELGYTEPPKPRESVLRGELFRSLWPAVLAAALIGALGSLESDTADFEPATCGRTGYISGHEVTIDGVPRSGDWAPIPDKEHLCRHRPFSVPDGSRRHDAVVLTRYSGWSREGRRIDSSLEERVVFDPEANDWNVVRSERRLPAYDPARDAGLRASFTQEPSGAGVLEWAAPTWGGRVRVWVDYKEQALGAGSRAFGRLAFPVEAVGRLVSITWDADAENRETDQVIFRTRYDHELKVWRLESGEYSRRDGSGPTGTFISEAMPGERD